MHEKLAVWTRVAAVLGAVAIGWLLYTIKSDLSAIGDSLPLKSDPIHATVTNRIDTMSSLEKCLCSPTLGLIRVVTVCANGESPADCAQRHRDAIARWKLAVPDAVECDCPP